jgi:hypothetical protein
MRSATLNPALPGNSRGSGQETQIRGIQADNFFFGKAKEKRARRESHAAFHLLHVFMVRSPSRRHACRCFNSGNSFILRAALVRRAAAVAGWKSLIADWLLWQ